MRKFLAFFSFQWCVLFVPWVPLHVTIVIVLCFLLWAYVHLTLRYLAWRHCETRGAKAFLQDRYCFSFSFSFSLSLSLSLSVIFTVINYHCHYHYCNQSLALSLSLMLSFSLSLSLHCSLYYHMSLFVLMFVYMLYCHSLDKIWIYIVGVAEVFRITNQP